MYCFKNQEFENDGFENQWFLKEGFGVEIFLFLATPHIIRRSCAFGAKFGVFLTGLTGLSCYQQGS